MPILHCLLQFQSEDFSFPFPAVHFSAYPIASSAEAGKYVCFRRRPSSSDISLYLPSPEAIFWKVDDDWLLQGICVCSAWRLALFRVEHWRPPFSYVLNPSLLPFASLTWHWAGFGSLQTKTLSSIWWLLICITLHLTARKDHKGCTLLTRWRSSLEGNESLAGQLSSTWAR